MWRCNKRYLFDTSTSVYGGQISTANVDAVYSAPKRYDGITITVAGGTATWVVPGWEPDVETIIVGKSWYPVYENSKQFVCEHCSKCTYSTNAYQRCWARMPTGCSKTLGESTDGTNGYKWFALNREDATSEAACINNEVLKSFNAWCSRSDAVAYWRAGDTFAFSYDEAHSTAHKLVKLSIADASMSSTLTQLGETYSASKCIDGDVWPNHAGDKSHIQGMSYSVVNEEYGCVTSHRTGCPSCPRLDSKTLQECKAACNDATDCNFIDYARTTDGSRCTPSGAYLLCRCYPISLSTCDHGTGKKDGNYKSLKKNVLMSTPSMCHSDSADTSKAWIKLDLGTAVSVALVKIYNRANDHMDRFGEHVIETSLDDSAWKTCGTYTLPSSFGPHDESCEVASARYVRLRKTQDGILNLGEVEIYSKSGPGGTATTGGWEYTLSVSCSLSGDVSLPITGLDTSKYFVHIGADSVSHRRVRGREVGKIRVPGTKLGFNMLPTVTNHTLLRPHLPASSIPRTATPHPTSTR